MPSGTAAKRFLLLAGLGLLALFLAGLITGAIGTAIIRGEDAKPFLESPHVTLPPQPIFPKSAREKHLFPASLEGAEEHGIEFVPLGMFEFAITNTMLSAWLTCLVMILLFGLVARRAKMVPGRLQNLVEIPIEIFLNFVESVVGRDLSRRVFPITATIFFFVLFNAWMALLPFYHFIGFKNDEGQIVAELFRSAGPDLNMPLALALVSFVFVEYMGLRVLGFAYLGKFIPVGVVYRNIKRKQLFQAGIAIFVGLLEGISEVVRLVSFTFRLFGNMLAGEVLVLIAAFLVPFVVPVFVYGLELLVGLVQALIFAGLTLVFVSVATTRHEQEQH